MNVLFGARSTDFETYFGHFWDLILDLEAETLPESKLFDAASAHIVLEGWFYQSYGFLSPGRVEFPPKCWLEYFWVFRLSKTWLRDPCLPSCSLAGQQRCCGSTCARSFMPRCPRTFRYECSGGEGECDINTSYWRLESRISNDSSQMFAKHLALVWFNNQ